MKLSTKHVFLGVSAVAGFAIIVTGAYFAFRAPSTEYDPNAPAPPEPVEPVAVKRGDDQRKPLYIPPKPRAGDENDERTVAAGARRTERDAARFDSLGEESDILALIERAISDTSFDDQPEALVELGKMLAKQNFELAMRMALGIDDSRTRNALLRGILYAQAAIDPRSALAAAFDMQPLLGDGEVPTLDYRRQEIAFRQALLATVSGWASTDPVAALAYVNGQLDERYQSQAVTAVYTAWAESDPEAAIASAGGLEGRQQREIAGRIYRAWADSDAASAMVHASENLEDGRTKNETLGSILRTWAAEDLPGAVAWVQGETETREETVSTLRRVAYGLASDEPANAAELLNAYPELVTSRGLASRIASEWSQEDPEAAAAWTETLSDSEARASAIKTTAGNWASEDFDQAYTWAQGLPDEQSRAFALSNVALRQASEGMDQPTTWIQNMPGGFARDRTVAGYSLGVLRQNQDYGSARTLQREIGNESVDMQKISSIVEEAGIPEDQKALLRNMY